MLIASMLIILQMACGMSLEDAGYQGAIQPEEIEVVSLEAEVIGISNVEVLEAQVSEISDDIEAQEASDEQTQSDEEKASQEQDSYVELPQEGEYYYDLENVVLYLYLYDELPDNYITKSEARELGWEGGSVEKYQEGAAIGGDTFGNREELLPEKDERTYTECDLDTDGENSRGAKRLVFSNDGLCFYSEDHYETFYEVTVMEGYEVVW